MATDICSICTVFLGSSKTVKATDILELLETLLVQINFKLLEELLICDTCLTKVQSACKFKTSYLKNSQKLSIKYEDIENNVMCEICKERVNSIDCIPLFYSVTEIDKLNLFKFLSSELELTSHDSPQTCELCHQSILNFCTVVKSFSVFAQHQISSEIVTVRDLKESNSDQDNNVNSDYYTMDIKEEDVEVKEDIELKEDIEVKEELGPSTSYEDFLCKNEELDLKTEGDPICGHSPQQVEVSKFVTCNYLNQYNKSEISNVICDYQTKNDVVFKRHLHLMRHENSNEIEMFRCQICDFQTKHKVSLKRHLIRHKNSNEVEIFRCQICGFQTKLKGYLNKHLKRHKDSNEIEMFKCQICDFQTKRQDYLKGHLVLHANSNEVEIFRCQICGFQTKRKCYLNRHLKRHKDSNEIEMFKCQICDFQTKRQVYLKGHLVRHTNSNEVKIFRCQICDFETMHKYSLRRHNKVNHKISNTIFKCKLCCFYTRYKRSIKKHINIHKTSNDQMICRQPCDFENNSSLKDHDYL